MPRQLSSGMRKIRIWIASGLLALVFGFAGASKLMSQEVQVDNFMRWGYPFWFLYVVGAWEVLSAIAVLVPVARFYGATWLHLAMYGAIVTHALHGEYLMIVTNAVLMTLAAWVAYVSQPAWITAAIAKLRKG